MAASQTAAKIGHFKLTATTVATINLTGPIREYVEILHQGDDAASCYFTFADTEALLVTIAGLTQDDIDVIASGERLKVGVGPNTQWFAFYSAGAPTMSVVATP